MSDVPRPRGHTGDSITEAESHDKARLKIVARLVYPTIRVTTSGKVYTDLQAWRYVAAFTFGLTPTNG